MHKLWRCNALLVTCRICIFDFRIKGGEMFRAQSTFTWILQSIYMMLVAFDMTKKSRCLYCVFFAPREKHTVMFCLSRCEKTLPPSLLESHHVSFDTGTYLMSPPALRLPKAHNRRTEGQSYLPSFKSCPCKWDVLLTLAAPLRAIYAIAE